ncbi:MAG: hypothetical protein ABI857_03380 [Acidobacteriota bacterium]
MFPYEEYRDTVLWQQVDAILSELEKNQDITLTTAREYVGGMSAATSAGN